VFASKDPSAWLHQLMLIARSSFEVTEYSARTRTPFSLLSVEHIQEMLTISGNDATALIEAMCHPLWGWASSLRVIPGAEHYLAEQVDTISAHAITMESRYLRGLVSEIDRLGLSTDYGPLLTRLLLNKDARVRQCASLALRRLDCPALLSLLDQAATERSAKRPAAIAQLLDDVCRVTDHRRIEQSATVARHPVVKADLAQLPALLSAADNVAPKTMTMLDGSQHTLASALPELPDAHLTETDFDPLWDAIEASERAIREQQRAIADLGRAQQRVPRHIEMDQEHLAYGCVHKDDVDSYRDWINALHPSAHKHLESAFFRLTPLLGGEREHPWDSSRLDDFFFNPDFPFPRLVRAAAMIQMRGNRYGAPVFPWFQHAGEIAAVRALRKRLRELNDLRYLTRAWLAATNVEPLCEYLQASSGQRYGLRDFPVPGLNDYVLEQLDLIDEGLGLRPKSHKDRLSLDGTLEVLSYLEQVPRRYLEVLMELALGKHQQRRKLARQILAPTLNLNVAIADRLSGKQRLLAADWLAERGASEQIGTIEALLRKEKTVTGRSTLLTALQRLGADLDPWFDIDTLLAEAEAGLTDADLQQLQWLHLDRPPECHWRDGHPLAPILPRWWAALAITLKQPGGNALFDLCLQRLTNHDAARIGAWLLHAWIDYDTARPDQQDCERYARGRIDEVIRWRLYQHNHGGGVSELRREQVFAELVAEHSQLWLNNATSTKGVLALAACTPDTDLTTTVQTYLREHSARVVQCKALIELLAHSPGPQALQVLLATAASFKSRSVQVLAREKAESAAERHGWSSEQLADRLVSNIGMDTAGRLRFDCGDGHIYTASIDGSSLAKDAKLLLHDPFGAPVRALPSEAAKPDEALLKATRKSLTAARRELKQEVRNLSTRLYTAMCVQRSWNARDWQQLLLDHPLAGQLCKQLLWLAMDAKGRHVGSFTPLDDKRLVDAAGGRFSVSRGGSVKLAHRSLLTDAEQVAWLNADPRIELFEQLRRPLQTPPPGRDANHINDRQRWLTTTAKLRTAAGRYHYQQGEVDQRGNFDHYFKPFEAAGLAAVVRFSGSHPPEQDGACDGLNLHFQRFQSGKLCGGSPLALSDIPVILLSEAWNDYHDLAASGNE